MRIGFLGSGSVSSGTKPSDTLAPGGRRPSANSSENDAAGLGGKAVVPPEVEAEFVEISRQMASGTNAPHYPPPLPALLSAAEIFANVATCRAEVADALLAESKDYRALCALVQSGIPACDMVEGELRRRLAADVRYAVLGMLDEACSIALANGGSAAMAGADASR
jgi:hypothetical protein